MENTKKQIIEAYKQILKLEEIEKIKKKFNLSSEIIEGNINLQINKNLKEISRNVDSTNHISIQKGRAKFLRIVLFFNKDEKLEIFIKIEAMLLKKEDVDFLVKKFGEIERKIKKCEILKNLNWDEKDDIITIVKLSKKIINKLYIF